MKTFVMFVIGACMVSTSDSFTVFVGSALVAWAYYRCGKDDGIAEGKRQALSSGTKM